ncbi:hypothetical protein DICPUDRAFT_85501 [Dictyostelium purpureum]|uniref:THH1/TOM1/TOM3 domain-containing protein n=1 Tax=Dictyostelium purpureum TaxID=5786 RepID=F1A5X7_DICPU|nr:uncharacterized protein DICPUDRAFT_85501 [Dictyostelium purpureum]EGC28402.1 hypothetical protein DICPUDRAFT_85501 [Dictyostelium purpureum]|eukprot:XP_003295071.1 hypothetical protein DICPUDRAFT_85501 [Dictyostelium purpureum]
MYPQLYWATGSVMCFIGLVSCIQLIRFLSDKIKIRKIFFITAIIISMFSRGVYFITTPLILDNRIDMPLNAYLFWNHMVDFSFFLAYLMLFISWLEFYYTAKVGGKHFTKGNGIFIIISIFAFSSVSLISALFFISNKECEVKKVDIGTSFYIATLNLLTSILFGIYGIKIYKLIEGNNQVLERKSTFKIKIITWICSFCFLARTFLMLYSAISVWNYSDTKSFDVDWYLVLIYFVTLEIVPTCALLFFLRSSKKKKLTHYEKARFNNNQYTNSVKYSPAEYETI